MKKIGSYGYEVQKFIDKELNKVGMVLDSWMMDKRLNSLANMIDVRAVKRYAKEVG